MIGPDIDARGGVASVVKGYYRSGLDSLCELKYITSAVEGPMPRKLIAAFRAYKDFRLAVDEFDIVHVHMSSGSSYERKRLFIHSAIESGKSVILHTHSARFKGFFESANSFKQQQIRSLFSSVSLVVTLSEQWRDFYADSICDVSKIRVLHNGVRIPQNHLSSFESRDILFLGRLDDNKSPDVLLLALKSILEKHPKLRVRFCGDGDIDLYRRKAEVLGVEGNCDFLGWVDGAEKEILFERSGILCLPSKGEGMPMSVLEAMAHGLTVIATPVGGIPRIIEDGVNGCIVPVGDISMLADSLERLVDDASLRNRLGRAGRKVVMRDFDEVGQVRKLANLYEAL